MAAPAVKESAVSRGLRVPTSLRSAAAMALERDKEAAAARRKRVDDQAIVRKVCGQDVRLPHDTACNQPSPEGTWFCVCRFGQEVLANELRACPRVCLAHPTHSLAIRSIAGLTYAPQTERL